MFCSHCGTPLKEGAAFCKHCGQKVHEADDATVILQPTPAQQQNRQHVQSAPQQPVYSDAQQSQQSQQAWHQPEQPSWHQPERPAGENDGLITATKVFLIIGCLAQGWMLIPLIWCLPITISCFKKMNDRVAIGTGMKVITLLFVSIISGICMLCMKERNGRI